MNPIITPAQIREIVLYTAKVLIERQIPQPDEQAISDAENAIEDILSVIQDKNEHFMVWMKIRNAISEAEFYARAREHENVKNILKHQGVNIE